MKSLDDINAKIEQAIGKVDQVDAKQTAADAKAEKRIPISSLPFTITTSGSYYLTGNLTLSHAGSGITVSASDVTIDLNGFTLASTTGSGFGITFGNSTIRGVTVRNGFVTGWQIGLSLAGRYVRVEGVTARDNSSTGIACSNSCVVVDCVTGANSSGISVGSDGVILRCVSRENTGTGITTGNGAVVAHSTSRNNTGAGIVVGEGSSVQNCAAFLNTGAGINTGSGAIVAHNTVRTSAAPGISVGTASVVLENSCTAQLVAEQTAISASSNSRIERNHCSGYGRGIVVTGTANFIVKNTVNGGTQYVAPAGNKVGAIVAPPNSTAISGNSGGGLATTDPWANFAY